MATTATITLSSDIVSDTLKFSTSATLTKAGGATNLTDAVGLSRKTVAGSHAQYTLFDGSDYTADGAHKVYLKNTSTNNAEYFAIDINSERMGKLYAGDWALFPWDANAATNDIKIDPSANDMTLEYMLFYE